MAEIIRTEVRTERRTSGGEPQLTTRIETTVRSIYGSDVSVIRDFVAALDAAGAPATARIEHRTMDLRLTGFTAQWTVHVAESDAAES